MFLSGIEYAVFRRRCHGWIIPRCPSHQTLLTVAPSLTDDSAACCGIAGCSYRLSLASGADSPGSAVAAAAAVKCPHCSLVSHPSSAESSDLKSLSSYSHLSSPARSAAAADKQSSQLLWVTLTPSVLDRLDRGWLVHQQKAKERQTEHEELERKLRDYLDKAKQKMLADTASAEKPPAIDDAKQPTATSSTDATAKTDAKSADATTASASGAASAVDPVQLLLMASCLRCGTASFVCSANTEELWTAKEASHEVRVVLAFYVNFAELCGCMARRMSFLGFLAELFR